jgi:hypothetical protein
VYVDIRLSSQECDLVSSLLAWGMVCRPLSSKVLSSVGHVAEVAVVVVAVVVVAVVLFAFPYRLYLCS